MSSAEEQDIQNVLKILEQFSETETSRMKLQVTEAEGESVQKSWHRSYHHGRCDVGSPWAKGRGFDVLEE